MLSTDKMLGGFKMVIILALASFVFITKLHIVECYVDKRGLPCANPKMLAAVPSEYKTWHGAVKIRMECEAGHDMPLTAPDYNIFTCKPDGSEWDPPIFPDCNKEVLPTNVFVRIGATLTSALCAAFSIPTTQMNSADVTLQWNRSKSDVAICFEGLAFSPCRVVLAKVVCDPLKHKDVESVKDLKLDQPHIFIKIQFPYKAELTGTEVEESVEKVKNHLKYKLNMLTDSKSEVSSSLSLDCPSATRGAITEADRLACRGCPLGHYLDPDIWRCRMCQPGYYNDEQLQSKCKMCPSMRNISNNTIWNTVNRKLKDGSYALSLCPTVIKDKNGYLKVQKPADSSLRPIEQVITQALKGFATTLPTPLTSLFCCIISIAWARFI